MRSLQPPNILWIHWRVYNFIANTSKGILFLPPSDAYVRSFLYILYTLIKLYYTKALSDQASSLAPDWILLLRGPRIPVSSRDSTTTFQMANSLRFFSVNFSLSVIVTPWTAALQASLSITSLKGCCWTMKRHWDSWLLEEKYSIWGQRRGLIAQSFCVIKFY